MYTPTPSVLTVAQLNNYVKSLLERDDNLCALFVTGEISNFKYHSSGHLYMSLKDKDASIKAVMFQREASRLKFLPTDGMKVIIRGRVSLYPRDGSYQLYIDDMQPDGLGALNLAFEQLKEKLQKEGLFDEKKKKPLPQFPKRVGVITSKTGAAVRDIVSVLKRRYPQAEVVFCASSVQGVGAAEELAEAVRLFNKKKASDVLIIGRGGGSLEDLWAFNEEVLARAVAASKIPVISAVGHETDFTICDFVADCRAPTPSVAAELAVPDAVELSAWLSAEGNLLYKLIRERTAEERTRLTRLKRCRVLENPQTLITDERERLERLYTGMNTAFETRLKLERERLYGNAGRLNALSPLGVLKRGYSIVFEGKRIVSTVNALSRGSEVTLRFQNGDADAVIKEIYHE